MKIFLSEWSWWFLPSFLSILASWLGRCSCSITNWITRWCPRSIWNCHMASSMVERVSQAVQCYGGTEIYIWAKYNPTGYARCMNQSLYDSFLMTHHFLPVVADIYRTVIHGYRLFKMLRPVPRTSNFGYRRYDKTWITPGVIPAFIILCCKLFLHFLDFF